MNSDSQCLPALNAIKLFERCTMEKVGAGFSQEHELYIALISSAN